MSTSLLGWFIGHPTSSEVAYLNKVASMDFLAGIKDSQPRNLPASGRSKREKAKVARSRDGSSEHKSSESSIYFGQGDLVEIKVTHIEHLTSTPAIV